MTTLVSYLGQYIIPVMTIAFLIAVGLRVVIYYMVLSEQLFVQVFKSNVKKFMKKDFADTKGLNFHKLAEYLLNRSFFEYFDLRRRFKRRRGDSTMNFLDRLFLFEIGTQLLIEDILVQTQYHHKGNAPDFDHVSKHVYNANPYYNKLFGLVPIRLVDNLINILPGLFIIGGIMGTFMGIMQGIPELKIIDVTDTNNTKKALEGFLNGMAYAMSSSIVGIFLSVLMNIINTGLANYSKFVNLVDEFKDSLRLIWNEALNHPSIDESHKVNEVYYGGEYFRRLFNTDSRQFQMRSHDSERNGEEEKAS